MKVKGYLIHCCVLSPICWTHYYEYGAPMRLHLGHRHWTIMSGEKRSARIWRDAVPVKLRDALEGDTPMSVLDTPLGENDVDAATIREYLGHLIYTLWDEGEGFNGKRPFGNSSWEFPVYEALIRIGVVDGELDEDGYVKTCDLKQCDEIIHRAIKDEFGI